jgi:predicted outer membrane repeat protein
MSFHSWLQDLQPALTPRRGQRHHGRRGSPRAVTHRPSLEALEVRTLLSTFTVTNLFDSGPDSLRAAVASANANPGPDAIDLATTGTITLTSGQLSITDSLTISGPGIDALTISGGGASRVFLLPAGNRTVSIANLTVANGRPTWSSSLLGGGGIYMAGGTLTLDHCTVSGNRAINEGGGIYMAGGTLTLNQSTVSGNYAEDYGGGGALGGGLFVADGTLTLDQCTVAYNSAVGSPGYYADFGYDGGRAEGGGLYVAHGTVSVNRSNVYGNSAVGGEGRVDPFYTTPGNGGLARGGGIRIAGGGLDVRQSTFSGNMAVGGLAGSEDNNPIGGGLPGVGEGGGLFMIGSVAYLDTFTVDHTINNNPDNIVGPYHLAGMPMLAIRDVTVLEGNTGTTSVVFTISLSAASDQPVTVAYATADGTATAGSDYVAASGTLTIPAGQTTGTITVPVNGDRLAEPNETFVVNLSSLANAVVADGQGMATIVDDEPHISITPSMSRSEGNTGQAPLAFAVTLSSAYDAPVTVAWGTAAKTATAGGDYLAASGTLTFAPGETSKTVNVLVKGDRVPEPDETFVVNLSSPTNAIVVAGQGVGTIVDDEPRISIGDVTGYEGRKNQTTTFTFTVTLSAAYDQPVTMSFGTADGTAKTSDRDYVARTGTLTFAAGETSKIITIVVQGDSKRESDETFYLDLFGNSSNSLFTKKRGLGTIRNDD